MTRPYGIRSVIHDTSVQSTTYASWGLTMRRSWQETQELIEARKQDFVDGATSLPVLQAQLKCLGLTEGEIAGECHAARASRERLGKPFNHEAVRKEFSLHWLRKYLKR